MKALAWHGKGDMCCDNVPDPKDRTSPRHHHQGDGVSDLRLGPSYLRRRHSSRRLFAGLVRWQRMLQSTSANRWVSAATLGAGGPLIHSIRGLLKIQRERFEIHTIDDTPDVSVARENHASKCIDI
jgi:hypothetical protein